MPELDTATLEKMVSDYFLGRSQTNLMEIAQGYSIDELIHAFENLRRSMLRVLAGLDEAQVNFSPNEATYCLSEVVSHLMAAQGETYNAFIDLSSSTLPHIDPVPRGPGGGAEKGLTGPILQDRLEKATALLIAGLRKTYDPHHEQTGTSARFGKTSHKSWMFFQLAHDLDHLKQAQGLRRSPDFPKKQVDTKLA